MVGFERDADACGDGNCCRADVEGLLENRADLFGKCGSTLRSDSIGENGELIAAEPGGEIAKGAR